MGSGGPSASQQLSTPRGPHGGFIAYFSAIALLEGLRLIRGRQVSQADPPASGPYFSGLALTALNPFFLLWRLTVGLVLVALTTITAGAYALVALL
ncbi:MAG: hypothetical protein RXN88_04315 [Acidilobus sp.]